MKRSFDFSVLSFFSAVIAIAGCNNLVQSGSDHKTTGAVETIRCKPGSKLDVGKIEPLWIKQVKVHIDYNYNK